MSQELVLKSVQCRNCLLYRLKHSSLFRCFMTLMLTSHYYRQCIIGSLSFCCTPSDEFGCSFKMSDYWQRCACNEARQLVRICLKIVNLTDDSALYYATLPMILWTWCKIWDEWHDRLSFVWFSMPLFIFCIIVLRYQHVFPESLQ